MYEKSIYNRRRFLRASVMSVTAFGLGLFGKREMLMARPALQLSTEGGGATGWLNFQALRTLCF
jgi:hypothetical protein